MSSGSSEDLLDELRPVSFAIAYRMLGSVAEAEDIVQEALLRVHRAVQAGERIDSPRAFVATITTRLAIDELRSARARRERYVGEWLPEPILTDSLDDPAQHAEIADSLSMAMLVLLETLSPEQRAVLLLRDVFDYGYGEIAGIVGKNEDNVRQLAIAGASSRRGGPSPLSDLARAARRARPPVLRGGDGGRSRGPRGAARPRRGAHRRRRRQGAGAGTAAPGSQPRRSGAGELDQAGCADPRRLGARGRGQRYARSAAARRRGPAGRRVGARDRRRSDPGDQLGRQSRQARPPGAGGGCEGAAPAPASPRVGATVTSSDTTPR